MASELIQPLIEVGTRNVFGGVRAVGP